MDLEIRVFPSLQSQSGAWVISPDEVILAPECCPKHDDEMIATSA
jgi:hypothetical protein